MHTAGIMAPASRVLGDLRSPGRCIAAASTRAAARISAACLATSLRLRVVAPGADLLRARVHTGHDDQCPDLCIDRRDGQVDPGPTPGESPADGAGRGCRIMVWFVGLTARQACSLKCNE